MYIYAVPPRIIEDLEAMVDARMLRRVRLNAMQRTAACLGMNGGHSSLLL